jgi:hypothetical protein
MIPRRKRIALPPKLANEIKRLQLIISVELAAKVEGWRRHQPDPMPNTSEAIRRLIEIGIKADASAKPKPAKKGG